MVAGKKLEPRYKTLKKELKDKKEALPSKIDAAVQAIFTCTQKLESLSSTEATMVEVDRGTDRCVAAVHDQLDGIERAFDHGTILPLTEKQAQRRADAMAIRKALMPAGTSFLRLVYSRQWVHLNSMGNALADKETAAAVARLGLTEEVERVKGWIGLYGAKLGVTESREADPAAVAVEEWHQAYAELIAHVHSDFVKASAEIQKKVVQALLAPYDEQADEERRAESKARSRRPEAEPVAPNP